MGEIIKLFVKNYGGVTLVRCCSSCKNHNPDLVHDGRCICKLTKKRRRNDDLCSDHEIDDRPHRQDGVTLKNLRVVPTGKVKKPEYLKYIRENLSQVDANSMTQIEFADKMNALRKAWEYEHGSRYWDKW